MFVVALSLFALSSGFNVQDTAEQNPVARVVELIRSLKGKIEADGKAEQKVYDKFACWCEQTTARKAKAIEDAKTRIEELSKNIIELKGRLGSYTAEIAQLQKDIAETKDSMAKAEEMRKKEHEDYLKTKAALELATANLKRAIEVLGKLPQQSRKGFVNAKDGPMGEGGDDKASLLATAGLVETDVLTIAAGVRSAMHLYAKSNDVSGDEFGAVKHFITHPGSLLSTKVGSPHKGTYNTQSTMIQGILKEMKESMERDLDSATTEEGEKKDAFDELHDTKTKSLNLLQATLMKTNTDNGGDTKQLAEDEQEREETQAQLKTDEEFFETTKDSCKAKADEWAERSRLRTEELAGISKAIDILTSADAVATFASADTTFVQVSMSTSSDSKTRAYKILKASAKKTGSLHLAFLAAKLSTTGHFDAVIGDIDNMIQALRDEETSDVKHRDWCQTERHNADSKNEALEYDMQELQSKVGRLETKKSQLNADIATTEDEMSDLEDAMKDALDTRNTENSAFKQALEDDTNAIELIAQAMQSLSKFYTNNGLALVEKKKHQKKQPEYSENEDTAPETFSGGYGGRSSENTGIVAILGMIKEDLEKEVAKAKEDEAAALAAYQKLNDESMATMAALEKKKTTLQSDVADTQKEITDTNAVHSDTSDTKDATDGYLDELRTSCDWIDRTFQTRRDQRKDEIAGLQNAKSVLSGAAVPGLITKKSVSKHESVQQELDELSNVEAHFEHSFLQRGPRGR